MKAKKIIKESLKVLILGSLLSSIGGLSLEAIKTKLSILLPLVMVLPALADMIGDAGIIFVSKVTTYLDSGKIKLSNLKSKLIRHLFFQLLFIFSISSVYVTLLSITISYFQGFSVTLEFIFKMLLIVLLTTIFIVVLVFSAALIGAKYAFKKKIDPDDLLIPITTSIADLGSLIIFSLLVIWLF